MKRQFVKNGEILITWDRRDDAFGHIDRFYSYIDNSSTKTLNRFVSSIIFDWQENKIKFFSKQDDAMVVSFEHNYPLSVDKDSGSVMFELFLQLVALFDEQEIAEV